ncbi:MAG: acetylxylan esterase [Alphaproteobacteria bacterium]
MTKRISSAVRSSKLRRLAFLALGLAGASGLMAAKAPDKPVIMTAEQDHQNMMDQLGIKKLRPGVQNDVKAKENPVNYDEKKANPWPNYPDPLVMENGEKVTTANQWWNRRRPELIGMFEREIYGRIPASAPKVTWSVQTVDREFLGFTPIVATKLIAHADNSAYPAIKLDFPMMLIKPAQAKGPMPLLIMFTFGGLNFPAPAQPSPEEFAKINQDWKAMMIAKDPSLEAVFEAHPAWQPFNAPPFAIPPLDKYGDPPPLYQFIADGWAVAMIEPNSIQADGGAGLTQGVIGLSNKGQPRKPEDWGVLRAWAWGASRALDYLETDPDIDAKHVGIEGVSRYGKAALVAMAFDQRFGMALVASSGESGTKPHRRNYGETVENQAATAAYHWMAGNFLKYAAEDSKFGAKNAGDIPIDAGELIALCAPRLTFISYGSPAGGDPPWVDQHGGFMATVQAGKVFRLLGAKDLGVGDDYSHAKMPPVNKGLLDGQLAWRQHDGGHTDGPNFKYFIQWADKMIGRESPSQ